LRLPMRVICNLEAVNTYRLPSWYMIELVMKCPSRWRLRVTNCREAPTPSPQPLPSGERESRRAAIALVPISRICVNTSGRRPTPVSGRLHMLHRLLQLLLQPLDHGDVFAARGACLAHPREARRGRLELP